uniref:Interleukin-1 receptor-like 1 n=1 Tax=Microcebus murinus TaxID=30608 RepID=A0A8B7EMB0_MICMU|nr:interleukin-1 receptor-like 1 isoform X2 [Microcebus murinus]
MGLWILAILTVLIHFTAAKYSKLSWGLENEALIVRCPKNEASHYPVDWYYSKTHKSIPTQETNRVFSSGKNLKFLPAKVDDSGIYTCIIRSPTFNKTGYANVTIYKKQPNCNIPDYLMYSTVSGSEKNSKIYCPTVDLYNWTAPLQWFKNCQALQGSRYKAHRSFLVIDNVKSEDAGDYTCKFTHNENGVSYSVSATRSFTVQDEEAFSLFPVIRAPPHNETKEVEIGKTVNITCFACFGGGAQFLAVVLWHLNGSEVKDFGEARIEEEEGQNQSSSNEMTCLTKVLRIADVKEEDLSLKYDCLALNLHGLRRHTIRLSRKNPNGKIYDAYVIYPRNYKPSPEGASPVEYFVHQILPDVLENKCGYNLCIYGRDLLPGEDAATAVETNIRKSRRHIFILTPQSAHSKEFAYEQEMALHSTLIQNDSKAILIEMKALSEPDGLQVGGLQDSLKHLMKVQGTIKWREDHVANKRSLNSKFWKHVRYQMPVPSKLPRRTSSLTSQEQQCLLGCAKASAFMDRLPPPSCGIPLDQTWAATGS